MLGGPGVIALFKHKPKVLLVQNKVTSVYMYLY